MTPLNEIIEFFREYDFNRNDIVISQCEKVIDTKKFVKSHILILKANKGNRLFLPYYTRLHAIYIILKNEK